MQNFSKPLSSFIKYREWAKQILEFRLEEIVLLFLIHCALRKAVIVPTKNIKD